jgi:HSP20 family molecular chaperone IbpA
MLRKSVLASLIPLVLFSSAMADESLFADVFGDDIFKEMVQMQKQMDQMFAHMHQRIEHNQANGMGANQHVGEYQMMVQNQLRDQGDHYELMTNIPESKDNRIDLQLSNGLLSIRAEIVQEENQSNRHIKSVRIYQQSISTPQDIDSKEIKTFYKDKKLVVSIAKKTTSQPSKKSLPTLMKK